MKKAGSIILLLVFLFNVSGYYFLFLALDAENRGEMQVELSFNQNLETIRLHKSEVNELTFRDGRKEVLYKGDMYDVKSISEQGDFLVIRCINDKTEKQLISGLNKHIKNHFDTRSPGKKRSDHSKRTVKNLFCNSNDLLNLPSRLISFRPLKDHFASYISPRMPLPPRVC